VVVDGGAEVFELAPGRGVRRSLRSVLAAPLPVHVGQGVVAEERQQRIDALRCFQRPRVALRLVLGIEAQHVGDRDLIGVTDAP
jgi:hypothetical protein